jgi:hypothetical protein
VLALLSNPADVIPPPVIEGMSLLAQTLIGAVALVSLFVACIGVWVALKQANAKALEAEKYSLRLEKLTEKADKRNERMLSAFSEMEKTVDALVRVGENGERIATEQVKELAKLGAAVDGAIRDAIRRSGRSYTPPPGASTPPRP